MDEKNINISKSEEELLEIMENRSHITADQLHNLKEDEECLQACSDLTEIVIEMQKKQNMLAIDVRNELADFHNKHSKNDRRKNTRMLLCYLHGRKHHMTFKTDAKIVTEENLTLSECKKLIPIWIGQIKDSLRA